VNKAGVFDLKTELLKRIKSPSALKIMGTKVRYLVFIFLRTNTSQKILIFYFFQDRPWILLQNPRNGVVLYCQHRIDIV
jgi:hypothetical protein